jgi:hypothetical protein
VAELGVEVELLGLLPFGLARRLGGIRHGAIVAQRHENGLRADEPRPRAV